MGTIPVRILKSVSRDIRYKVSQFENSSITQMGSRVLFLKCRAGLSEEKKISTSDFTNMLSTKWFLDEGEFVCCDDRSKIGSLLLPEIAATRNHQLLTVFNVHEFDLPLLGLGARLVSLQSIPHEYATCIFSRFLSRPDVFRHNKLTVLTGSMSRLMLNATMTDDTGLVKSLMKMFCERHEELVRCLVVTVLMTAAIHGRIRHMRDLWEVVTDTARSEVYIGTERFLARHMLSQVCRTTSTSEFRDPGADTLFDVVSWIHGNLMWPFSSESEAREVLDSIQSETLFCQRPIAQVVSEYPERVLEVVFTERIEFAPAVYKALYENMDIMVRRPTSLCHAMYRLIENDEKLSRVDRFRANWFVLFAVRAASECGFPELSSGLSQVFRLRCLQRSCLMCTRHLCQVPREILDLFPQRPVSFGACFHALRNVFDITRANYPLDHERVRGFYSWLCERVGDDVVQAAFSCLFRASDRYCNLLLDLLAASRSVHAGIWVCVQDLWVNQVDIAAAVVAKARKTYPYTATQVLDRIENLARECMMDSLVAAVFEVYDRGFAPGHEVELARIEHRQFCERNPSENEF